MAHLKKFVMIVGLMALSACTPKTSFDEPVRSDQRSEESPSEDTMKTSTLALQRPVEIEMYTDFSCPWCYIGTERMSSLLERYQFSERVRVHHRVYLLAENTPEEGVNIAENLRRKYGREPAEMFAGVEAAAHAAGLPLDYSKLEKNYPTLRAHALVLHAAEKGTQNELKRDLFRANFVDAKNINAVEVLIELGERHGFTADEVRAIVNNPAELDAVRRQGRASASVAQGVPYFVMNDGPSISGAQPEAVLVETIRRAGN